MNVNFALEDNTIASSSPKVSNLEKYELSENTDDFLLLSDISEKKSMKVSLNTLREYIKRYQIR